MRDVLTYRYDFRGANIPPTSSTQSPWIRAGSGSGASATLSDGALLLAFDNTSEAARQAIYFNDHLAFDIDDLVRFEALVKFDTAVSSNVIVGIGMTSAFNATLDSIAQAAIFRVEGDNDLLCETDDGTNNNDDVDSGFDAQNDWQRLAIDFSGGVQTRSGVASLGGKGNVQFFAGNAAGYLRRCAAATQFDMSNYSGGLQPFLQIQKGSSTDTGNLYIREVCVQVKAN